MNELYKNQTRAKNYGTTHVRSEIGQSRQKKAGDNTNPRSIPLPPPKGYRVHLEQGGPSKTILKTTTTTTKKRTRKHRNGQTLYSYLKNATHMYPPKNSEQMEEKDSEQSSRNFPMKKRKIQRHDAATLSKPHPVSAARLFPGAHRTSKHTLGLTIRYSKVLSAKALSLLRAQVDGDTSLSQDSPTHLHVLEREEYVAPVIMREPEVIVEEADGHLRQPRRDRSQPCIVRVRTTCPHDLPSNPGPNGSVPAAEEKSPDSEDMTPTVLPPPRHPAT